MALVRDRRVLAALVTGSALALALVLVGRGNAGNSDGTLTIFALPAHLTAGNTGFAGAAFTPTGAGTENHGTATHVTIALTFPAVPGSVQVTSCPGVSSVAGVTATCAIKNVKDGQTVKMFATYRGASSGSVDGQVVWDVPRRGGKTGGRNTVLSSSEAVAVFAAGSSFGGDCTPAPGSVSGSDSTIGKSTSLTYAVTADSSLGFPCTPAEAGVEQGDLDGHTPGIWSLSIAPLAGGAAAHAVLTLDNIPLDPGDNGVADWDDIRNIHLFELLGDPESPQRVPRCGEPGDTMPSGVDACVVHKKPHGAGVQFTVNILGTAVDPRFTS
ncbi:MAG: hypothetical protein ACRDM1_00505 [Gaiellaceae bacterium]